MEVLRPWAMPLLLLALVPLLWRRRRSAVRWSSFLVLPPDRLSRSLEAVERCLGAAFVVAAIVGIAEPRTGPTTARRWSQGARLVFVVDQSASMFSPWSGEGGGATKIAVAREAIRGFVERRPGDRLALVGFGRSSVVYAPLSADERRFLATLDLLNADFGDTVIDAALLRALGLLEADEGSGSQAVILLSDGAGRLRQPERISALFRTAGVRLYWLVIEGGRNPEPALAALLVSLGEGGRTFRVGGVNELPAALDEVGRIERRPMRVESRREGTALAHAARWAALGCLLLLGAFALGGRAGRAVA